MKARGRVLILKDLHDQQRVVRALNTMVRHAEITPLPDGRFAAKRAA